jgi:hypothetical protein
MNIQLKLLLEEMIKNRVLAEVNGIETKVALREVTPEFYPHDEYTEKDIKIIICPRYIKPELSMFIIIHPIMITYDISRTSLTYKHIEEIVNCGVIQYIQNIIDFTQNKPVTVRHIETPLDEKEWKNE